MSRTASDTPNAWRTGWWQPDEELIIERAVKRLSRKLERAPSSVVRRINKMEREGRFTLWESKWRSSYGQ
jgi:hypothetical protein